MTQDKPETKIRTYKGIAKAPEFMWLREVRRAHGAAQAFAAMFIRTVDDAREILEAGAQNVLNNDITPENLLAWAESMRADMDGSFREEVIQVFSKIGWHTNTHPGFALGMMAAPYLSWDDIGVIAKFDAFCESFAEGKHPWVNFADTETFLGHWLSENAPGVNLEDDSEFQNVLEIALTKARVRRLTSNLPGSDGLVWEKPQEAA